MMNQHRPASVASRLSPEGLAVLHACAASSRHWNSDDSGVGGCMFVADLVRLAPGRRAVVRASLSRTLRRLWHAGWVELFNAWGYSLTARHADADAQLQEYERDPDATYAQAAAAPGFFPYVTPEEYLVSLRERALQLKRGRPVHVVQITSAGRERLTARRRDRAFPPVILARRKVPE
jgi:hypothetical protein